MALADIRREYGRGHLHRRDLDADPVVQFQRWFAAAEHAQSKARRLLRRVLLRWFDDALAAHVYEPNSMVLATVSPAGVPAARVVLLKGCDAAGLVFYTCYDSDKGRDLAANPQAALLFYWKNLERQVRVTGAVVKVSRAESEAYFATRPRRSQLSAWASAQSQPVTDRAVLEAEFAELDKRFAGQAVPTPANWGGYRLVPTAFEFWQGRLSRLHDRFRYTKEANGAWRIERLAP